MSEGRVHDGRADVEAAVASLAARVPEPVRPLAAVVYNYRWSWVADGRALFHDLDPYRWQLSSGNVVRLLEELTPTSCDRIAASPELLRRIDDLAARVADGLAPSPGSPAPGRLAERLATSMPGPVAFMCSEFGVHSSLPIYSGGLGVLAGDILKEASDQGLPYVGIGLLYRRGYFQQRVDLSGWQHEWWDEFDPDHSSAVRVTVDGSTPLVVSVPLYGREISCQIWRVDVGRVPLYLLDTERPENTPVDRWITARLYEGNRAIRLAQYGVLGIGGIRALRALGYDPGVVHLNEGHPALAVLELARESVATGLDLDTALHEARAKVVFTTHTPVPAGNETYPAEQFTAAFASVASELGMEPGALVSRCRVHPDDPAERPGLTPLALRLSRHVNGVSRRHAAVARDMWWQVFPDRAVDDIPINAVTNGVHLPTFMAPPFRELLDATLGDDWSTRTSDPGLWRAVDDLPTDDLWSTRCRMRAGLVERVRRHSVRDRLLRGEQIDYVEAAAETFDADTLTVGFARRIATYKRLHLLTLDPSRALARLDAPDPLQLLFAGKAHPDDDGAKRVVQQVFSVKGDPRVGRRVAFLENYDLSMAAWLVAGCDVWVNLPRPPNEASGTSGMKAALNGGLNLSVLDGWWAEAFDGANGWGIDGDVDGDEAAQDDRHATRLYELLEQEVVPLFYERDDHGVPRGWVDMIKASLRSLVPRFAATRMVEDYVRDVYAR